MGDDPAGVPLGGETTADVTFTGVDNAAAAAVLGACVVVGVIAMVCLLAVVVVTA